MRAPVVISNADARHTFENLIGAENAPRSYIGGLAVYLCRHWTQPGSATFRVIFSGIETTLNVLGPGCADQFLRDLDLGP